jgi:hypothetical protein
VPQIPGSHTWVWRSGNTYEHREGVLYEARRPAHALVSATVDEVASQLGLDDACPSGDALLPHPSDGPRSHHRNSCFGHRRQAPEQTDEEDGISQGGLVSKRRDWNRDPVDLSIVLKRGDRYVIRGWWTQLSMRSSRIEPPIKRNRA